MAPWSILVGFALGLSLAAPPGPVNALILREATRHGAWGGVRAGLPAPTVDTAYLLLVVFGLPRLFDVEAATPYLAAVGALLMLYLARDTVRMRGAGPTPPARASALWAVTLSNPFQYAWWLSAGSVFLTQHGPWGALGFVAAVYGWVFAFSHLGAHGAARWSWFTPLVTLASADLLFTFALLLAWTAAGL